MMLTPIPGSQVMKQVQEQLTAFVASQNFQVGDRLPSLRELTAALGVSRTSVREGLRALEALGIVEIRHGSGIYVASGVPPMATPSHGDTGARAARAAREILAVRLALEPEVAALAAANATADDLARLTTDVEDFRRDFGKVSNPASDLAFHLDLCRSTHNNAFIAIMVGRSPSRDAR